MTSTSTSNLNTCEWCGCIHSGKCPSIKAIEYHENGKVKRIEFFGAGDHVAPVVVKPFEPQAPQPTWIRPPLAPWESPTYTLTTSGKTTVIPGGHVMVIIKL